MKSATEDDALAGKLFALGVVPVISIDDAEKSLALVDALVEGGLPLAEITFRTDAAAQSIRRIADRRPDVLVGAGTLLTADQARQAKDAGARFGLAPGYNPEVAAAARKAGLTFFPGVATATEVERGIAEGHSVLKFFPAEIAGGLAMLKALAGPYAGTGVRFVPTGGIKLSHLADYLANPLVLAVGGTWIADRETVSAGDWSAIARNARAARDVVLSQRGARDGTSEGG